MAEISPQMAEVVKNIYNARLAEQGERFEDMVTHMKAVVKVSPTLFNKHLPKLYYPSIGWSRS